MISQKADRSERKYQRYYVDNEGATLDQIKVKVEGEPVRLVNYSLGGLYFLSTHRYSSGDVIQVSIDIKNQGKIDLLGTVVQVRIEEGAWGIGLDFSTIRETAKSVLEEQLI